MKKPTDDVPAKHVASNDELEKGKIPLNRPPRAEGDPGGPPGFDKNILTGRDIDGRSGEQDRIRDRNEGRADRPDKGDRPERIPVPPRPDQVDSAPKLPGPEETNTKLPPNPPGPDKITPPGTGPTRPTGTR